MSEALIAIRVEAATYKGEPWFVAKGGLAQLSNFAYGRTPERAAGFLLRKLADDLLAGTVVMGIEPATATDYGAEVTALVQHDGTLEVVDVKITPPGLKCRECNGRGWYLGLEDAQVTCTNCKGEGKAMPQEHFDIREED